MGEHSLQYHPTFEATLYFTVSNGPSRNTAGVSNYQISIEKDGKPIDKSDLVPGTYDIHVTRAADADWNELDTVLEDCLIITKQTSLIQWSDLELTANPGETLSGTLTIPLPQGYDGATACIKGGASASSYTATTVTFPLTLDVSGNTAEAFELLIEYKEAQEPVQPQPPQTSQDSQPSREDDTGLPVVTSPAVPRQVAGEVGQWVTFTVAAQDGQAYQWYLDRQDGQGPQPLAGATGTSFSAQPLGADWSSPRWSGF